MSPGVAMCNPGEVAVGGGGFADDPTPHFVVSSFPTPLQTGPPTTGWAVGMAHGDGSPAENVQAFVVCASP
jgi:hypothetical protein